MRLVCNVRAASKDLRGRPRSKMSESMGGEGLVSNIILQTAYLSQQGCECVTGAGDVATCATVLKKCETSHSRKAMVIQR